MKSFALILIDDNNMNTIMNIFILASLCLELYSRHGIKSLNCLLHYIKVINIDLNYKIHDVEIGYISQLTYFIITLYYICTRIVLGFTCLYIFLKI